MILNISSVWNLRYFWQPSLPMGIKMSSLFNSLLVLTILSSTQAEKSCSIAQYMKTNSTIVWVYIDVLSIITYYPQRKSCIYERCQEQTINQKIICVHRFNVHSWRWKSIGFSVAVSVSGDGQKKPSCKSLDDKENNVLSCYVLLFNHSSRTIREYAQTYIFLTYIYLPYWWQS